MTSLADHGDSRRHVAPARWAFDDEVTRVFADMLARSIPDLDSMRRLVHGVGRRFVRPGTDVVDLGCSRGDALAPFVEEFGSTVRAVGVEVSPPMLAACRARFADEVARGSVVVDELDLARGFPDVTASLTLVVLTLQFLPVTARARVLRDACERTVPGGALVLVEKVRGASDAIDELMVDLHEASKRAHGYSQEAIDRKRLSLDGVLVPLTAPANEALLADAGFGDVDVFWRCLNFAAWIAVKPATARGRR